MSAPAVDFDFSFPYTSIENMAFTQEPSLMDSPLLDFSDHTFIQTVQHPTPQSQLQRPSHTRSSSHSSTYSTASSGINSTSTFLTTPSRASPIIHHHHGPILLPKIRPQDQDVEIHTHAPNLPKRNRTKHTRSSTSTETLNAIALGRSTMTHFSTTHLGDDEDVFSQSLLCSPADMAVRVGKCPPRRRSTADAYKTYCRTPSLKQHPFLSNFNFPSTYTPREPSPLGIISSSPPQIFATPDPTPRTTINNFLSSPNPAPSLVRTLTHPHRDPNMKHFWWDVRNIRSWTGGSPTTLNFITSLPAAHTLHTSVPCTLLPHPTMPSRHPETEAALHSIYTNYYLPKLNSALALSSPDNNPLQITVPNNQNHNNNKNNNKSSSMNDLLFTVNPVGESGTSDTIKFGGKPTARIVGLVRTFDRFNTGMRSEGNIKRVEYLRGLSAVHHAMREHGTRYGFIINEIELVLIRNGTDTVPYFGDLEVTTVALTTTNNSSSSNTSDTTAATGDDDVAAATAATEMSACLALWGLCQLAGDVAVPGQAHWKSEIGAPAEGTRKKAKGRDKWMPNPQLSEKRQAKRGRGWIMPEDAVGRKELGKRGVNYSGCC